VTKLLVLVGVVAVAATPTAFGRSSDEPPEDPGVTGIAHCTVPSVRGAQLADAKRRVLKARCGISGVMRKRSNTKKGRVVLVVPRAGTVLAQGTGVLIVVSAGS
jgi:beta-lactam-binding protein with PASTA domain